MTTAGVETLCDETVWAGESRWRRLYLPLGAVIALLRLMTIPVLTLVAIALPRRRRRPLFRALLWVMGLRIRYSLDPGRIAEHTDGCVVAGNHVSLLDAFLVIGLPFATVMAGDPFRAVNKLSLAIGLMATQCAGGSYWTIQDRRDLVRKLNRWKAAPHGTALYISPETTINNGQGLFLFLPDLLCRGMPVVPLAIRLTTPFGLNAHPLHEPGALIALRLLMMPWLRYELTFLPRQEQRPDQDNAAFARQIQEAIAHQLAIPATSFTRADKHAYRRSRRAAGKA